MINKIYTSIIWLFIINIHSIAQHTSSDKKAVQYYEKGLQESLQLNNKAALNLFKQAIEKDSNFAEAHFQIGRINEHNNELADLAISHYNKAISISENHKHYIHSILNISLLHIKKNNYSQALAFLQKANTKNTDAHLKNKISKLIANCVFGSEQIKTNSTINLTELNSPFNEMNAEYFPSMTADKETFIFTGKNTQDSDENIYITQLENGIFGTPKSISDKINTPNNEGTASISGDGNTLVFTACNNPLTIQGSCDLFVSYKKNNDWSKPINLGKNINTENWESQPSLSIDGRTLYFVSNRKGGAGAKDIWASQMNDLNQWQIAQNLGKEINTPEDDISPFIHSNSSTLFFASAGHIGMGGLDIFLTHKKNETNWTVPENLGFPINNANDQLSLYITADNKKGYFSIENNLNNYNRQIKLINFDIPDSLKSKFKKTFLLKGVICDKTTNDKLEAEIELVNLADKTVLVKTKSNNQTGEFLTVLNEKTNYGIFVSKKGYLFKSLHIDLNETKGENQSISIELTPIKSKTKETLNNIFFDSGKYDLKTESFIELNKLSGLLKENPNLKIQIAGHTDNTGNKANNMALSQKRANAVVEYLQSNGIDHKFIVAKGYGDSMPITSNVNENEKQQNRRIEIVFE
ncbi:MAG: OmpA family protein [Pseudarcicella sp.]|nr:OmpA family protein [Pseudarcicella sp.]